MSANSVQSLSHVLSLIEGTAEEKCRRTLELFDLLKQQGIKYGTSYELPTLGVLALSSMDLEETASNVVRINGFLSQQKGFGAFGIGAKQRFMYAGMLANESLGNAGALEAAYVNSTISIIAAQQAAMVAAIAASSAATSASS